MVGFAVSRADEQEWGISRTRPQYARTRVDLTTVLGLEQSRARLWRYPPGASGVPHVELVQEEVFVVLAGTLTLVLGDPPEAQVMPAGSVAMVKPGTAIHVRNDGDELLAFFVCGAPPAADAAETLPEPTLS